MKMSGLWAAVMHCAGGLCGSVCCTCRAGTYVGLARTVYIGTPYMTVYLVISLLKIPYMHRIDMVLANPTHMEWHVAQRAGVVE